MKKFIFSYFVFYSSCIFASDQLSNAQLSVLANADQARGMRIARKFTEQYQIDRIAHVLYQVYGVSSDTASLILQQTRFDVSSVTYPERLKGQLLAQSGNYIELEKFLNARPLLPRREYYLLLAYVQGRIRHEPFIQFCPFVTEQAQNECSRCILQRIN